MTISESSITLNFPDDNFFRLQDCKGYKDIQDNFKEMDACWYEQATDTLFIIELKNWENNDLVEENNPDFPKVRLKEMKEGISKHRIDVLLKKSIDSICMFLSILLEKPYAPNLQSCMPFSITKNTKIKLITIINWTEADTSYIHSVNGFYKTKFNSYAKLFEIGTFTVLTKHQAIKNFSWVS